MSTTRLPSGPEMLMVFFSIIGFLVVAAAVFTAGITALDAVFTADVTSALPWLGLGLVLGFIGGVVYMEDDTDAE